MKWAFWCCAVFGLLSCGTTKPPTEQDGGMCTPGTPTDSTQKNFCGTRDTLGVTLFTSTGDGTLAQTFTENSILVPGSQSGFHVWLRYGITAKQEIKEQQITFRHTVRRRGSNTLLSRGDRTYTVPALAAGAKWDLPADTTVPAFLCPPPVGETVVENDVTILLQVIQFEDIALKIPFLAAEASADTHLVCPTDAQGAFCLSLCSSTK